MYGSETLHRDVGILMGSRYGMMVVRKKMKIPLAILPYLFNLSSAQLVVWHIQVEISS
jgi:hypothetical protein